MLRSLSITSVLEVLVRMGLSFGYFLLTWNEHLAQLSRSLVRISEIKLKDKLVGATKRGGDHVGS